MIKIINVISNLTRERYKKKGDNVESCYFPVYIILKKSQVDNQHIKSDHHHFL